MSASVEETKSRVAVEVSDDKMEAWLKVSMQGGDQPPSGEEVVAALKSEGIDLNEYVAERVEAYVSSCEEYAEQAERFSIAKGCLPVEGKDGEFTWDESLEKLSHDWQGDAPINYYALNSIVTVEQDEPVGTITPPTPGTDGLDVYGKTLTPKGKPSEVQLDQSVYMADDGSTTVVSKCAGKIIYENRMLSIDEVFCITGDVDFRSGNVDSCVNVDITGNIGDLFTVESTKSITVGGAIEAAKVKAKGDIVVRGGILGRAKGAVEVEGEIIAKFCDEADLHAQADVKIAKEVMNSRVVCQSKLLAARGSVIGGDIYAREGVEVTTLGSDAGIPTNITVGIHPEVLREASKIDESMKLKRDACERVRQAVQPLLAELKRLTRTQKEQATELLLKADAINAEIDEAVSKRDEMIEKARATGIPYVQVSKMVHQGVSIRIGHRHTVFDKELKGPVRIEKRKVDRVTEFVAVNQLSGSITVLPSAEVVDREPAQPTQSDE